MKRYFYSAPIAEFLNTSQDHILGELAANNPFRLEQAQRNAWLQQIHVLQHALRQRDGSVYFEYSIPRMGKRIDVVLIVVGAIFVLEFKVGKAEYSSAALDQVCDYALDLKNFHQTSASPLMSPILVATEAGPAAHRICPTPHNDKLLYPILCNSESMQTVMDGVLAVAAGEPAVNPIDWENSRYRPTPTIIEAALALYRGHSVSEISRNDAEASNLSITADAISAIVREAKEKGYKSICFVTGVPGAGKTLVGLKTATKHQDQKDSLYSVFLSGNGPLVAVLREALARDHINAEKDAGRPLKSGAARSKVRAFIQNVHHFRDECLTDLRRPPVEHVAIFDEAQRAWNLDETASFMKRKKNTLDFAQSEPEFLISCLDRHRDWAAIVCLVGGGQEINRGEAGISEWIESLERSFPDWRIYISPKLTDSEFDAGHVLDRISRRPNITYSEPLHLSVSMRSFRSEKVSNLVKQLLDLELRAAQQTLKTLQQKCPIVLRRDLSKAKQWLRAQARGSERYGILVSSQAGRLRPHAINVKAPMDPIHWFLDGKEDVRSSYYLEDVPTEFHVQGLELDWACVTWDADFRHAGDSWEHWSFVGSRWNSIRTRERQAYLKNAYRVLLTRARPWSSLFPWEILTT